MPWTTPTLFEVRALVRDSVRVRLPGADAMVPNSVLRVMSDNQGALCHATLQYIDWLARQLLPDTAEAEWLDRHGQIWLVNADGSKGRKTATLAAGTVNFTGAVGTVIPQAMQLTALAVGYETTAPVTLGAGLSNGPVRALDPGIQGNLLPETAMSMLNAPAGAQTATVVEMDGGTDTETDEQLRSRILKRIQNPPMGGDAGDYEQWALAVPGVTRAWSAPQEAGIGTMTVRFLMDDLRAADDGWPNTTDIATVQAYIDSKRPVTVKDCYVVAPIKQFINITILDLVPNTEAAYAEVEASLRAMLFAKASPGQTIFAAWVSYAIMNAPDVQSFDLVTNTDYVMASNGNMAVLGTVLYLES